MPKGYLSRPAGERGSLLILALWTLLLLSTMAVTLAFGARQKISLAMRLEHRENLRTIAEAGIQKATAEILQDIEVGVDAWGDGWASNRSVFREISVGSGTFTIFYETSGYKGSDRITRYGVQDEEQKLNINVADADTLSRLFEEVGDLDSDEALDLAYSIVDWRDTNSVYDHPQHGAEDGYYQKLRRPYEAKDADFEVLEELLLVKGMGPELFELVRGHLTPYGAGAVNINTAPVEVLGALGLGESVIEKIQQFRFGLDGLEGTGDEYFFTSTSGIVSALSQLVSLDPSELAELSNLVAAEKLGISSQYFMIQSEGRLETAQKFKSRIICIFERLLEDGEVVGRVVAWREGVLGA